MSKSNSFWDHPIEQFQEALDIRKQIAALQYKLSGFFGGTTKATKTKGVDGRRKKRSAATIAKMKAAQQARWAHLKGGKAPPAKKVAVVKTAKKRGKLTPEGRAKLAAAMKARWAARKANAAAPLAKA